MPAVVEMHEPILALLLISFFAAVYLYIPVQRQVSKDWHLSDGSMESKFAVDPYVWSHHCSQRLRLRYMMSQFALIIAIFCGSYLGWDDPRPAIRPIIVLWMLGACLIAISMIWKLRRMSNP
jgi:hypothetical protein